MESNKLKIGYYKYKQPLENIDESVKNIQQYQPIYSLFFDITETTYNKIQLNNRYQFIDTNTVLDTQTNQSNPTPIFIKYSPLYDPLRYMMGKYDLKDPKLLQLPTQISDSTNTPAKFLDTNNASYIDGFFIYLTGELLNKFGFKHGINYYGSFLGIQQKFKMNIYDDYEHLQNSTFFRNNCDKLFHIDASVMLPNSFNNNTSRAKKNRLDIDDNDILELEIETLDDVIEKQAEQIDGEDISEIIYTRLQNDDLDIPDNSAPTTGSIEPRCGSVTDADILGNMRDDQMLERIEPRCGSVTDADILGNMRDDQMSEHISISGIDESDDSSDSEQNNSDSDSETNEDDEDSDLETDDEDDDVETDEDEDESEQDDEILDIYIDNFPIQMICMEKCHETMDTLFDRDEIDEKTGASALFQIIMILLTYQRAFNFTHNDLHTNNIMYIETKEKFLFYKENNIVYRVPTYGRIFKIIDFGRSIYKFDGKLFCSDSFAKGGDASTQYNFPPYVNTKKPIIEPNMSFDLCRLGTSIFDFILDVGLKQKEMDELQKTIHRWCQDDFGKNVLYKKNGEERYPNFKLYKMIARTVHNHTPEKQLEFPFFNQFRFSKKLPKNTQIMNLDVISLQ